ncbi:MAG: hypothetical protein HFF63_09785 [Oscillospiraceae bacterium]|jgi:hypothetical protein|nr:hypothetical protein [Oscillospiraceae bacterium]
MAPCQAQKPLRPTQLGIASKIIRDQRGIGPEHRRFAGCSLIGLIVMLIGQNHWKSVVILKLLRLGREGAMMFCVPGIVPISLPVLLISPLNPSFIGPI